MPEEEDSDLANLLAALGAAPRLELLRQLQAPRALREISMRGERADAGTTLSRQSVRTHLDRLLEVGLVIDLEAERGYGATREYVVNHQTMYALGEEVKALSRHRPTIEPPVVTTPMPSTSAAVGTGPRLVLVKGLDEGATFALDGSKPTLIGRRRGADVPLDFDPYVSSENSVIEREDGRHVLVDCPGSRNGTRVNFRRLGPDERHVLAHGDVIGVGHSALVYWS